MSANDGSQNDRDLVAYAFMCALNNGSKDLMHTVFMPMFKRAISKYSTNSRGGKDTDAKHIFLSMYGIDVPIYTIRLMLRKLESDLSRREKALFNFKVFEKGKSFTLDRYTFTSEEVRYQSVVRNARALEGAFDEYINALGLIRESIPPISEFITINRKKLAAFFGKNGQSTQYLGDFSKFEPHAKFFQMIDNRNQALFEIAENLFIGSVIAAYLESGFDLSPKFNNKTLFVLDTQFILRSLDLQQEEETRPATEVIEMIHNSGGDTIVLDVTIEEIERNLKKASDRFLDNPLIAEVGNNSIIHACHRREMTRTDIDIIIANITDEIKKVTHADLRKIPSQQKEGAEKSPEHAALKQARHKPLNALHDIICIFYIRNIRGGRVISYQKAGAWFVSSNPTLYSFNLEHSTRGEITEVITPEELASLLWLQNPSMLNKSVARVGIEELVAQAMSYSLVPVETLMDIHSSIMKLESISPNQYAAVASALASKSLEYLIQLGELAKSNQVAFSNAVIEIIRQQNEKMESGSRLNRETFEQTIALEKKYKEALDKISSIESELVTTKKRIAEASQGSLKLENERDLLLTQVQIRSRTIKWLLCSIVLGLTVWAFITFMDKNLFTKVVTWISGLGGLWSFGNFIFNAIRLFLKKKA